MQQKKYFLAQLTNYIAFHGTHKEYPKVSIFRLNSLPKFDTDFLQYNPLNLTIFLMIHFVHLGVYKS